MFCSGDFCHVWNHKYLISRLCALENIFQKMKIIVWTKLMNFLCAKKEQKQKQKFQMNVTHTDRSDVSVLLCRNFYFSGTWSYTSSLNSQTEISHIPSGRVPEWSHPSRTSRASDWPLPAAPRNSPGLSYRRSADSEETRCRNTHTHHCTVLTAHLLNA